LGGHFSLLSGQKLNPKRRFPLQTAENFLPHHDFQRRHFLRLHYQRQVQKGSKQTSLFLSRNSGSPVRLWHFSPQQKYNTLTLFCQTHLIVRMAKY